MLILCRSLQRRVIDFFKCLFISVLGILTIVNKTQYVVVMSLQLNNILNFVDNKNEFKVLVRLDFVILHKKIENDRLTLYIVYDKIVDVEI